MLSGEERQRYDRQIMLAEMGEAGQERLRSVRVLIVGAGGLGSPAALYLAAAGVGTIGLVDADLVEVSNLQRQIAHATADLGRPKVQSAGEKLLAINPALCLVPCQQTFDETVSGRLVADYDFVIDATDNFAAKFLINDTCVRQGVPYSHGGVLRFAGQTMTVLPGRSACYRCLFPEPPPEEVALACSRDGILGVLPGVIGTVQATEAIKVLLDIGEPLADRLLTYDALRMRFREVPVRRSPCCPVCSG